MKATVSIPFLVLSSTALADTVNFDALKPARAHRLDCYANRQRLG